MTPAELAFLVFQPSNTLYALLGAGLVGAAVAPRIGLRVAACAAVLIGVCGLLPVGAVLLAPLERHHPFSGIVEPPDGIIVLGGFLDTKSSLAHNQIQLNDYAERITAAASLARRFPGARVIVSDGAPRGVDKSGADLAMSMLVDFGVAPDRIVREGRSHSTWENAQLSFDVVAPQPGEQYVLLTSAFHMPRAMATFAAAGWGGLIPWPVDYAVDAPVILDFPGSLARGLLLVDLAAREYAALALYATAGRLGAPGADRRVHAARSTRQGSEKT